MTFCPCGPEQAPIHEQQPWRCLLCKRYGTDKEIDTGQNAIVQTKEGPQEVWMNGPHVCHDLDACAARQRTAYENNPVIQQITAIRAELGATSALEGMMAKSTGTTETPKAAKPAATPKDCLCGCGEQTGGGKFRPGHDARFVSALVKGVASTKSESKRAAARKKAVAASDALGKKFDKSLAAADAAAAKAAAAKDEKKSDRKTSSKAPEQAAEQAAEEQAVEDSDEPEQAAEVLQTAGVDEDSDDDAPGF